MTQKYNFADICTAVLLAVTSWLYVSRLFMSYYWQESAYLLEQIGFTAVYLGAAVWYMKKYDRKADKESLFYMIIVGLSSFWFVAQSLFPLTFSREMYLFNFVFMHGMAVYFLLSLSGKRADNTLDEQIGFDLTRGGIIYPLKHFGRFIAALAAGLRRLNTKSPEIGKNGNKAVTQTLAGVLIGVPVLCLIIPLLVSADESFAVFVRWIGTLFENIPYLFHMPKVETIWRMALTLLTSCYLFGMFYACAHEEKPEPVKARAVPGTVKNAFLMTIAGVYFLFFAVKLIGVFDAMVRSREGTMLYSQFAREGFFELCFVAAINGFIFCVVRYYTKGMQGYTRKLLLTLGVQTLAFVVLAFYKMSMYINAYGFTFLRIFTSWFMVVLFAAFIWLILALFKKLPAIRWSVWFGCITFMILTYAPLPMIIERLNQSFF